MSELRIERYDQMMPELGLIFPAFIKKNFDSVDFSNPEVQAQMSEWYWNPAQVHLLAYIGDELVGVAHVTKRESSVNDQPLTMACLGGLVVSKQHRGEGIAKQLLTERLKIAREWGADIAFLNTDIEKLQKLFSQFGFVPLGHNYSFTGKSGQLIEDDSGMVAVVNSEDKFNAVLTDSHPLFIGEGNL